MQPVVGVVVCAGVCEYLQHPSVVHCDDEQPQGLLGAKKCS